MSEVKRYTGLDFQTSATGAYVLFTDYDALAAQLKEAGEIIAASQYFHAEDFAENPADLDESCVSPSYLAHYKRVLTYLRKTKEPTT